MSHGKQMSYDERARAINGVDGRKFAAHRWSTDNPLFSSQTWKATRYYKEAGHDYRMTVTFRFDDNCKNGHNTFSATADVDEKRAGIWRDYAGGCMHDEIARVFPELAPLLKWHLCSTDGPMHYVANVLYFASDADHYGRRKGEPSRFEYAIYFGDSPVSHRLSDSFYKFLMERTQPANDLGQDEARYVNRAAGQFQVIGFAHKRDAKTYGTHYTLAGFGERWHECPFRDKRAADEFCAALNNCRLIFDKVPVEFSEGKPRELDKARAAAVWPEATDAELSVDRDALKAKLEARLPELLRQFRTDMTDVCGFMWD